MSKEKVIHRDIFNKEINVGDAVVLSTTGGWGNRLTVGIVQKLNPKMINVVPSGSNRTERRYPMELMVVTDNPGVSLFELMGSGSKKRGQR